MTDTLAPLPPAILLMGPTASGKTALALALARHIPVEIISVDSALVYRGMDIGAAKPSAAEQAQVPHHLIDIIDPPHAYSAAQFTQDARQLMAEITARGRVPLLAGGTMLYFKALQDGLSDLPAANPAVRAELDQLAAERGWPALHAELARIDPATAEVVLSIRADFGDYDSVRGGFPVSIFTPTSRLPLSMGRSLFFRNWQDVALFPATRDEGRALRQKIGQDSLLIDFGAGSAADAAILAAFARPQGPLKVLAPTAEELAEHQAYLNELDKSVKGVCLWRQLENPLAEVEA